MPTLTPVRLALPLLLALPGTAAAYSTGKTGSSSAGCTSCHGSSADSNVRVGLSSSTSEIYPGDTVTITLQVSSTDTSHSAAGLNVSATAGTLAAGSNNQAKSGEITHSSPQSLDSSGAVSFDFDWTAGSSSGSVTLYGAGNAVDENGGKSGDGWNTTTLSLTVLSPDDDEDGYTVDDGDCDDSDAAVNPGATEVCNDLDDDCDDEVDEDQTWTEYWPDDDGDGYGDGSVDSQESCEELSGYAENGDDCDDTDPDVSPEGEETWYDGVDQDCDGNDDDQDEDGYGVDDDCDDTDPEVWLEEDCLGSGDDGGEEGSGDDGGDEGTGDEGTGDDGGDDGMGGVGSDGDGDSDSGGDDGSADDSTDEDEGKDGCGSSSAAGVGILALLAPLGLRRRRD